nr:putative no exine formation 1 [Tanacetum cinerariifolium]
MREKVNERDGLRHSQSGQRSNSNATISPKMRFMQQRRVSTVPSFTIKRMAAEGAWMPAVGNNSWILTLGVKLASTGLIAGFVTVVTRGVVFSIALALLRMTFSNGSHGWRQLVDIKVGTTLTTRRKCCLSLQVFPSCTSEFTRDPAQRMKTPLVLPWERIPRLDSGVRIRI